MIISLSIHALIFHIASYHLLTQLCLVFHMIDNIHVNQAQELVFFSRIILSLLLKRKKFNDTHAHYKVL